MNDTLVIKALSITAILLFSVIFGGAIGVVAIVLGAAPAIAAVAAATIAVASAGVGLTVVTILLSSSVEEKRTSQAGQQ
jgi:hypothetical protein